MTRSLQIDGTSVPLTSANTIILGAGAAGMACAVRLVKFWRQRGVSDPHRRVLVVTGAAERGASRLSGSDKQTYYKMGTSPRTPDTAADFAASLTAGGCCHGDTALIEGLCSLPSFYHLVDCGVPFPHDSLGAFIGYKTDHDPYERATSAGPKTSRFMSECLQAEAERLGVRIIDRQMVVEFITAGEGRQKRIVGMAAIDLKASEAGKSQLAAFAAENWVLAAGGPGELYAATVYPRRQYGIHAPAFKAGLEACNLTESQFGLASIKFRWNVSGTYMQVVPRIYSTDAEGGDEREFLTEYFDDMPAMAGNIFLKGYQWPFDAQRIAGGNSSLIDMAVHQERMVRGRRVWMDFLHNPVGREGWRPFRLEELLPEARDYLVKAAALQETPLARLEHMNRPAIDIYAEHDIDLAREPLEIAVCAQHNNGGFAVNAWWESNVPHTFVIGEMAGTHGVKRPGGSALNAGQVGALRAAEYIAHAYDAELPDLSQRQPALERGLAAVATEMRQLQEQARTSKINAQLAMVEMGKRMTRCGAHLRWASGVEQALAEALAQYRRLLAEGVRMPLPVMLHAGFAARQQCLTHIAFLFAIREMLRRGAGSRGSHCVLDDQGEPMHPLLTDPNTHQPYRVKPENLALREHILTVRYSPDAPELFEARDERPRAMPERDVAFEVAWKQYREGDIYR